MSGEKGDKHVWEDNNDYVELAIEMSGEKGTSMSEKITWLWWTRYWEEDVKWDKHVWEDNNDYDELAIDM